MKIGTRGSKLALWQANRVREGLGFGELEIIKTTGDRFQDIPLTSGIGLFTKAIEEVLRLGEVDLAVHSLKDLPVQLIDGMVLGALLEREHPADVLLVRPEALDESRDIPLKEGAMVGTSGLVSGSAPGVMIAGAGASGAGAMKACAGSGGCGGASGTGAGCAGAGATPWGSIGSTKGLDRSTVPPSCDAA